MELSSLTEFISGVGVPVAMCGALFWYMVENNKDHKSEVDKLSEALNNNTIAITKLVDKIGGYENA